MGEYQEDSDFNDLLESDSDDDDDSRKDNDNAANLLRYFLFDIYPFTVVYFTFPVLMMSTLRKLTNIVQQLVWIFFWYQS